MQISSAMKLSRILFVTSVLWTVNADRILAQLEGIAAVPTPVMLVTFDFSADSSMFVAGGDSIRLYESESGRLLHQLPSDQTIRTARFSPTERDIFATTDDGGAIRIWRVGEKEPLKVLGSPEARVRDMAFSPDGKLIAGCDNGNREESPGGALKFWDIETGEMTQSQEFEGFFVTGVAFSGDGTLAAFSKIPKDKEETPSIEIYDNNMWSHVRSILYSPGFTHSISFAQDGGKILMAGNEHIPSGRGTRAKGRVWLVSLGSEEPAKLLMPLDSGGIRSAAFTREGDAFAVGTTVIRYGRPLRDGRPSSASVVAQIQIRDADSGEVRWSQDGEIGDSYDVTVSPDGRWVGCCSGEKILIFDAKTGEIVHAMAVGE